MTGQLDDLIDIVLQQTFDALPDEKVGYTTSQSEKTSSILFNASLQASTKLLSDRLIKASRDENNQIMKQCKPSEYDMSMKD